MNRATCEPVRRPLGTLDMPLCRCKRHDSDERGYVCPAGRGIVAAALLGAAATGLLVGSLAFSPSSRGAEPQVTLQIAPRAPSAAGAVSVTSDTAGVELDPPNEGQSVSACTDKSTSESSCHWGFPRGTIVKLTAAPGNVTGYTFAGWSTPDCLRQREPHSWELEPLGGCGGIALVLGVRLSIRGKAAWERSYPVDTSRISTARASSVGGHRFNRCRRAPLRRPLLLSHHDGAAHETEPPRVHRPSRRGCDGREHGNRARVRLPPRL